MVCNIVRLLGKLPNIDRNLTMKEIVILLSEQSVHKCHVPIIMKFLESNPKCMNIKLKEYFDIIDNHIPRYFRTDKD